MADQDCNRLRETLKRLFPTRTLNRLAAESGFVLRARKIEPAAFFWTLVLGFGLGAERSISALRCAYERSTGVTFVPSSFYDRFNGGLVRFLKAALDRALSEFRLHLDELDERFSAFRDIIITDATVMKLHDALKKTFPGCRTNCSPSAAKMHAVISVKGEGGSTIAITPERTSDKKKLRIGSWVKDRLLLFDLGYYRFQLFQRISQEGGYFLSRLKENANPTIVAVLGSSQSGARLVGKTLQEVLMGLRRDVLDAEITVRVEKRKYNGRKSRSTATFRLVAIRNHEKRVYHCYVTNVGAEVLTAEEVANTYRARWEIELLFKELKSGYRMDQIGSKRREVVEALIYSAVLTLVASREILRNLLGRVGDGVERVRAGRWWKLLARYAQELQLLVLLPPRDHGFVKGLEKMLLHELVDPHRNRPGLLQQTLGGTR